MSRDGGWWNSMQRTVSWTADELQPGETIDIRAQFEPRANSKKTPNFPVLIRCDGKALFSGIELSTVFLDDLSAPLQLDLSKSLRIVYRKI
jgi:hypothetical protein